MLLFTPKNILSATIIAACTLAICTLGGGCGQKATNAAFARENSRFRWLAMAYMDFTRDHRGRIPKQLEEFKQYVEKHGQQYMAEHELTLEAFFTSPRDSQPYVFFSQKSKSPEACHLIGYEQEGINGKRYVADNSGSVREVTAEVFDQLLAN